MIVCLCRRVSDRDIERAAREGVRSFEALQDDTGVGRHCGTCRGCARETFEAACGRHPGPSAGVSLVALPA